MHGLCRLIEGMQYKKNVNDVIHRNRRLWRREYTEKVLAKIDIDGFKSFEMWDLALAKDICPDYRKMFEVFIENFEKREDLLDDAMPTARPRASSTTRRTLFPRCDGWSPGSTRSNTNCPT